MAKKQFAIPIFIPHSGCPFQCIFCDQKKITGVTKQPTPEDIDDQIINYLSTINNRGHNVRIAFYGGNFTGLPVETQISYLKIAKKYLDSRKIQSIRLSTRPDYIDKSILLRLQKYGVSEIELGIQSFSDEVLCLSGRGYTRNQAVEASKLIRTHGFLLGHQFMIGLPGDSWAHIKETAKISVSIKPDMIRIYPTLVMENTPLSYLPHYKPLSLQDAVEKTAFLINMFQANRIRILRVGLHPPQDKSVIKAGPFHESFKFLVISKIWNDFLSTIKKENNNKRFSTVYTSSKDYEKVIGYKGKNKSIFNCEIKKTAWLADDYIIVKFKDGNTKFYRRFFDYDKKLCDMQS